MTASTAMSKSPLRPHLRRLRSRRRAGLGLAGPDQLMPFRRTTVNVSCDRNQSLNGARVARFFAFLIDHRSPFAGCLEPGLTPTSHVWSGCRVVPRSISPAPIRRGELSDVSAPDQGKAQWEEEAEADLGWRTALVERTGRDY